MKLKEKSAVVTGGGTGIGWAIAQALAAAGCRVAITSRREAVLRKAAESWQKDPPIIWRDVDVTNRDSVAQLVKWAERQLGRIDILVNSAGINVATRSMAEMRPEQWDRVLAVNTTGTYNCMYAVLPGMRSRHDGLILNISSISGKRPAAIGGVAYCVSKFAMSALGTCVSNEDAAHGIRVTNIHPGEVNTPILDNRPVPVTGQQRAAMLQPEDFGELVVAIARLHPRAHVPELVLKPSAHEYI